MPLISARRDPPRAQPHGHVQLRPLLHDVARKHRQTATLAAPQLGSCASSGCAWQLWSARHSQEEANPQGTQFLPRVLELPPPKSPIPAPLTFQARPLQARLQGTPHQPHAPLRHALRRGHGARHAVAPLRFHGGGQAGAKRHRPQNPRIPQNPAQLSQLPHRGGTPRVPPRRCSL